jgi:sugar lactone lactonase YvrE
VRYLLIVLTGVAAVAFVISVAVEAKWIGAGSGPTATPLATRGTGPAGATTQPGATPTASGAQPQNIIAYYFAGPSDVKVDPHGHVFVADTFNGRVVELGKAGTQFQSWGHHAIHRASMARPERVLPISAGFYVIDSTNTTLDRFSPAGVRLGHWVTGGSLGSMTGPTALAPAPDGTVYMADGNNDRVLHLTSDGRITGQWSTKGFLPDASGGPNDPGFPAGLAVDRAGDLYVAYPNAGVVQKFSPAGTPVAIWRLPQRGATASDVAVDGSGTVYVLDGSAGRVSKFAAGGAYITSWGGSGDAKSKMQDPRGMGTDASGHVYVADTGNNRVLEFSAAGNLMHTWTYG